ncbi:hypothetical protein C8J55DRAFT_565888 [Lentinula edodes]|uniref:Uncharacterized protein n=1 Tax=Lentinula lateritia TaxID=40482 RepID=A0A9W8ZT17_9AGAR|nr:hypothetical protein C8J55DRAFT_565888 [Lentinula edodes]
MAPLTNMDALFSAVELARQEVTEKPKPAVKPHSAYQDRFHIPSNTRSTTPENQSQKRASSQSPQKPRPKRGISGGRKKAPAPEAPPDDQTFTNHHWTEQELNAAFIYLFGAENDVTYNKWLKNKDRVYKKFLENHSDIKAKFNGSHEAVASMVTRNTALYSYIKEYETFMGGGSDADLQLLTPDSDSWHERRILLARKGGKALGTLTVKKYRLWVSIGWFGKSAKVDRVVVRNSAVELSPIQQPKDDSEPEEPIPWSPTPIRALHPNDEPRSSDSDDETPVVITKAATTPAPKGRKKAMLNPTSASSQIVSEPRHQSAAKPTAKMFKSQAADSLESISGLFDSRRQTQRLKSLRDILDMPGLDEETRKAVNQKIQAIVLEI